MRVLNARQMREADRRTIEDVGVPSLVLMENAGRHVVTAIEGAFDDLASRRVVVLCGRGNNGGDGFVVARVLHERGRDVGVCLVGQAGDVKGDAAINLRALRTLGVRVSEIVDRETWELCGRDVLTAGLVVDALFGTGIRGPLTGLAAAIVSDVNASSSPVVAIDLPSGLSADSSEIIGPSIDATMTVTMAAPKLPLVLAPADALAGTLVIADIGIPESVIQSLDGPWIEIVSAETARRLMPPRRPDSHKGTYGHVLVVAGSPGRTGAANLAARGALRSGAGLVTVATPETSAPVVAALGPEYMTLPLPEANDGTVSVAALDRVLALGADVVAVGPGLGNSPSAAAFVHALIERCDVPLVLDADGLNVLVGRTDRLRARDSRPIVVTPHPGEMARLTGLSTADIHGRRLDVARDFAAAHSVYTVLKGHRTVIATPDGRIFINTTGNPGMATGGSGDVLTGAIAAWLGQLHEPEAATRLAVYLHGLAGDLAAIAKSEVGLIAGDIADRLGDAVLKLISPRASAGNNQ
jgi:hydroxyethylthiazole kinase-like uncharacterized protein yjeF